jgi:hypothetical protein
MKPKHPAAAPTTLGREMGVKRLIANCLNSAGSPNAPFATLEMLTAERP